MCQLRVSDVSMKRDGILLVEAFTRTVKYWEHGQRTPNATSLLALAHYFDVPPESLLP